MAILMWGLKVLTGQTWNSAVTFPGQSFSGPREEDQEGENYSHEMQSLDFNVVATSGQ